MKRTLARFTAAMFSGAASLVVGCGRPAHAAGGAATEVRLGYFPNVTHAQALLGVASGDFAKAVAPAAFTAQPFNAGPSLVEALNAGQIDVGYVGPGPVLTAFARSHGQGICVVSGAAADGVVIVARKGAGIRTLADLKGRRVATPQFANTQDVAARHYLTATLGQADADNVLPVPNADQVAMMTRGEIDAAWDPEPWGSMLVAKAGAVVVGQERDLWPGGAFALTVVVTTPRFLSAHPDVIAKLLAVHRTWTGRLAADPGKYAGELDAALLSLAGRAMPRGVTAAAVGRVTFTDDPMPATFAADARWAFDLHFARTVPDLSTLFTGGTRP